MGGISDTFLERPFGTVTIDHPSPASITQEWADIAAQARINQYVATANAMHNAGINADAALPTGNGQRLDADTAHIFLTLANGDKAKARQAAVAKGWSLQ